jgi:hypothetical protein
VGKVRASRNFGLSLRISDCPIINNDPEDVVRRKMHSRGDMAQKPNQQTPRGFEVLGESDEEDNDELLSFVAFRK